MTTIKYSDIKNRNKVLLSVKWSHLKGNDQPYLSVDIKQVLLNGKRVHDWKEQRQVIKQLDHDLGFLVDSHLCNIDGSQIHMIANGLYYWQQTKEYLQNKPFTIEDRDLLLADLYDGIKQSFDKIYKMSDLGLADYNEFFNRLNKNGIVTNFLKHLERNKKLIYNKSFFSELIILEDAIKVWKETKNKYEYKTLPKSADLWTLDRFSEYSGIEIDDLKVLFFESEEQQKETLTKLFEKKAQENKKQLDKITKQHNIEIVRS